LPIEKSLVKKDIGFANKKTFSQERIHILLIETKISPKKKGFANREKFN